MNDYNTIKVEHPDDIKKRYDEMSSKYAIDSEWFIYHNNDLKPIITNYIRSLGYIVFADIFFEHNPTIDFYVVIKINPYQKQVKMYLPFVFLNGNTFMFVENYNLACANGFKVVEQSVIKSVFPNYEMFFNE